MQFWHHEHARVMSPINEQQKKLNASNYVITDTKKNGILTKFTVYEKKVFWLPTQKIMVYPQINIHESMYFGGMKYGLIKALTT